MRTPRHGIPTTYDAAVQLIGEARVLDEPKSIAAVLRRQLETLEPHGDYIDPLGHGAKLRSIRGIDLAVRKVRAKFKFGGNVDQAHRDHVARQLWQRQGPGDAEVIVRLITD